MDLNNLKFDGDAAIGICKGVSQRTFTNRTTGEIMTFTELGLATTTVDNFGYVQEQTKIIALSKTLIDSGAVSKLNALKDKRLILPVWNRSYKTKSGADHTCYLANDWEQTHFVMQDKLKAAS
ncbi:hypothetical protein J2X32_001507 [Rheinheimera pacifica]|uniref:DNA-binding protein n=1 Tax=Rheinheimera pacifica TaxID=173990 RepID=UPI00285CFBFB|nr:DNA-binding protein [Rheinheimera pacifica]MDR6982889.1 hypothetical protein [Rheinheimera pacifica]